MGLFQRPARTLPFSRRLRPVTALTIDRLDVIPIRVPNRVPITLATIRLEHQDNVIVRLRAGALEGLGETEPLAGFQGCTETQASIVPLIRERLAPLVVGQDAFQVERLVRDMEEAAPRSPYGRAAVVDALYDLIARAYDVPLYQLLGGLYRDRIPVVWTIGIKERAEMAEEARWAVGRGFRLLKVKVGARTGDAQNVAAVREAVGPNVGLRIDANGALTFDQALALLRDLSACKLEMVEQPLDIADLGGMARLIEMGGVPVMPDESLHSLESALALVTCRAASIFGMKLAKHGGIYYGQRIAAIAQAASIPIYPGGQPATSIGSATAAHFYAATWNATLGGDFHVGPAGWLAGDVVKAPLVVKDGYAVVPRGPGIGMELDEAELARYLVRA
jgi:muconate cycloisomerase